MAVLLAVCLTPFTAYADDAVTAGTLVEIAVRNPSELSEYVWKVSGAIDSTISDTSHSQTFDGLQFKTEDYVILDYTLTLPFAIPENSIADIGWHMNGSLITAGASLWVSQPYDVPLTSRYYIRWADVERVDVLANDLVCATFDSSVFTTDSDTTWLQLNANDIEFAEGIQPSFTFRCWCPTTGIASASNDTLKAFLNRATVYTMSCSTLLPSTDLIIKYKEVDQTVGMLQGIIEWLRGILDSITQLPQNIWSYVENGLKGLFVPDAEFMESYKSEWDAVLQDSMGGVYQSVSMIDDFYESFKVSSTQGTIHFPEVNVPVAGETFTFGGYEVDIVPDEAPFLQVVIDGIKLVMNAVCTLAVLQSFKRRYERVVNE